jgi:hypothetical protein
MHDLVKALIAEAQRRGAVLDPIAHHDLIVELDAAANGFTRLPVDELIILLDRPVVLSPSCTVRRLSESAKAWLNDGPAAWWPSAPDLIALASAWAFCHGRDRASLDAMPATPWAALRHLIAWRRRLDVPLDTIQAVAQSLEAASARELSLLSKVAPEPESSEPPASVGSVYAALMREHSCSLEHLLFDISADQLDIMLRALVARNLAQSVAAVHQDGSAESEAAVRRRHNWTHAKLAFLKAVLPVAPVNPVTPVNPVPLSP